MYINKYDDLPDCCLECRYFESDYNERDDRNFYYCHLNINLPTKKKTCKRQKVFK